MKDATSNKKWLHTVPGIIAAVGSLIGAIAALLVALHSIGIFQPDDTVQISQTKTEINNGDILLVEDSLEGVFDRMELGIKTRDEDLFKAQWHPTGYKSNLVGGSGIEGASIFHQGSREGWYIKPRTDEVRGHGSQNSYIITCDVTSWKSGEIDEEVYAGVIRYEDRWAVLGIGVGDRSDVSALVYRYRPGEPIQPKDD